MFGALRRLFGKTPAPAPAGPTASAVRPAAVVAPTPEPPPAAASTNGVQPPRRESPTQRQRAPKPDEVAVSFRAIFHHLPSELRGRLGAASAGHTSFFLPRSRALEQLAQGAIKVPFGELRRAAPLGLLVNNSDHDHQLITLPLQEILPQLSSEAYGRRPDQRTWQEPEDVPDLFGPKGQARAAVRVVPKSELKQAPTAPAPAAPESSKPAEPQEGVRSASPSGLNRSAPIPLPSHVNRAEPSAPQPPREKATKVTPRRPLAGPVARPAARTASPHASSAAAPATSAQPARLIIPVSELAVAWPEAVRQELQRLGCAQAQCAVPVNEITEPLKAGRVQVPFQRVVGWIGPKPTEPCAAHLADTVVELPLPSLVPRYLACCQMPSKPKQTVGLDTVPDLFTKPGRLVNKAVEPSPAAPATEAARSLAEGAVSAQDQPLVFELSELSAPWPEAVRRELAQFKLEHAQLRLPLDVAEKYLRQGKVEFAWKELCAWIQDCPQSVPSPPTAELRVELPLAVVAPRFVKLRPPPKAPSASDVAPGIPDLFSPNKVQSAPTAGASASVTSAPPTPAAAPAARRPTERPATPPRPAPQPANKPPKDIAEVFGEPDKRVWTPNELVHKTACLPGVAGALIALQDGLLVAHCMPPNWKTETVAAFLPQIFGRMSQYSRELQMGELRSLTFAVEGGTLQIFAAGIIYFAALGKPGVPLPQLELNLIATELSRHTK